MEPTVTFKFTQTDLNVIAEALGNMPLAKALNTFASFQRQIAEQQQSPTTPAQAAVVGNGVADDPPPKH
jgi:hypothetical protein